MRAPDTLLYTSKPVGVRIHFEMLNVIVNR